MKIFLDTNILISTFMFNGLTKKVVCELDKANDLYVSKYVLCEFVNKIYQKWPKESEQIISKFKEFKFVIAPTSSNHKVHLRDKKDDQVINDALGAGVDFLLTGDKDLIEDQQTFIKVYSPSDFINYIKK